MADKDVTKKLQSVGSHIVSQVEKGTEPDYQLPVRTLNNVFFDDKSKTIKLGDRMSSRQFLNVAHSRKFMQTVLVAAGLKKVIDEKATTSIRDLFYNMKHTISGTDENTFDTQDESDPIIEDIEAALNLLREELHLIATPKGLVAGNLKIREAGGSVIDVSKMGSSGWAVPSNVEPEKIDIKEVDADYVLFIEKYATWNRFNEDLFWKKGKCLLLTGKGQPARAERRFAQRLAKEHGLPVYALTDADPWGYYIYSVIKQGSISLSYSEEKLANPETKFIGLTTQDADAFKIPKDAQIKLNKGDLKRISEMKNYSWFKKKEWQKEFSNMKEKNFKMELEALSAKRIRFITENYLPQKIQTGDFLP